MDIGSILHEFGFVGLGDTGLRWIGGMRIGPSPGLGLRPPLLPRKGCLVGRCACCCWTP